MGLANLIKRIPMHPTRNPPEREYEGLIFEDRKKGNFPGLTITDYVSN
jgi:hypothetical protein